MLMSVRYLAAGVAALMLAGCMQEKVSFVALKGQEVIIRDGRSGLMSHGSRTDVVVSPASRAVNPGQRPVLVIGIRNNSGKPINFLMSGVTVRQTVNGQVVRVLPVKTYEQLVKEEQTRQIVGAILLGAAAGANSYSAANRYNSPIANSIASAHADHQNAAMIGNAAAQGSFNFAALEASAIKDNTIMPGETYGGLLYFDPPQDAGSASKTYSVVVQMEGDAHEISVTQSQIQT